MSEDAAQYLQRLVDQAVAARLKGVADLVESLEFVIAHIFNMLDQQGVMTRAEAIASLRAMRPKAGRDLPPRGAEVLRHVEAFLQAQAKWRSTSRDRIQ